MQKIERLIYAVPGLLISAAGFAALTALPDKPSTSEPLLRIGFICALFACISSCAACWAVIVGHIARRRARPSRSAAYYWAAGPFLIVGLALFAEALFNGRNDSLFGAAAIVFSGAGLVHALTRTSAVNGDEHMSTDPVVFTLFRER